MSDQKQEEIKAKRKALETFFGQLADLFKALHKIAPQHSERIEKEGMKIQAAIKAGVQFNKIVVPFHAKVKEFYIKFDGFKGQTQEQIFQKVLGEGILLANEHEGADQGLDKIWAKLNPLSQKHLSGYFFVLVKSAVTMCGPVVAQQRSVDHHQRSVDQQKSVGDADTKDLDKFVSQLQADVKSGKLHKDLGEILPNDEKMTKLSHKVMHDLKTGNLPPHLQNVQQNSLEAIKKWQAADARRKASGDTTEKTPTQIFQEMAGIVISDQMKLEKELSRKQAQKSSS
jgi:hypothetical protein